MEGNGWKYEIHGNGWNGWKQIEMDRNRRNWMELDGMDGMDVNGTWQSKLKLDSKSLKQWGLIYWIPNNETSSETFLIMDLPPFIWEL